MIDFPIRHWQGKKVCFLGDSITDGIGVQKGERYFDLLHEMLGIESVGYGVNGAQFIGLLDQIRRMNDEQGKNVDAIFLFAGTNDYNSSRPLGEWYQYGTNRIVVEKDSAGQPLHYEERRSRTFNKDETFRGCINTVLSELRHTYPKSQIVLMTPLHRAYAEFGPTNIQYPECCSNRLGLFIDDYVCVVREAAHIWSCELIDLHQTSGLFPLFDESADYFANPVSDRLHPGSRGHKRLAQIIAQKMIAIPVFAD